MGVQDHQQYGPMRRRGHDGRAHQSMATPIRDMRSPASARSYTGETLQMRSTTRRAARGGGGGWWLAPLIAVIVILATILGGLTYLDQTYAGRIYPNVSVQGVDLSEMTPEEAEEALAERFSGFLQTPVRFRYGERTWEPRPEEIGFHLNLESHVVDAMRAGRGNGLLRDVQQIAAIWQQGLDLPLHVSVDAGQVQEYLLQAASEIEQPPTEATLLIDPVTGALQSTESAGGRMLLLDDTVAEAVAGLEKLEPQEVAIRTQTLTPVLETSDVAEAKRTVEAMLQAPMELRFNEQVFTLSTTEIADMIAITRVEDLNGTFLNAQLDQTKLTKWVTRLADQIGRDSIEPRVAWTDAGLQIVKEGRSAYRLNIDVTVERLNGAVIGSERALDLPVDEVQPLVTPENLATLGINEVIATGRSDFSGSAAYRIANIKAGVNIIDGILVPPDGEFSFNENVGDISEANGFVEGYAIVGNRTQKEPGGGICQVSTTLYRAAFYAGLPFTEWNPHRFRISWYEKHDPIGMDAAIFTGGGPDLRFVNDTGKWILIEGYVDEASAMVVYNIYGTKVPGRTVERSEPIITDETLAPTEAVYIDDPETPAGTFNQTDVARGGMTIEIVRIVRQDGAELRRTSFITKFEAWPNIFLKNPNTPLPPGGKLGNS